MVETNQTPNVLIVDDEANILKTMAICLKDLGYNITTIQKPQEVQDTIIKQTYDLAFIDLKMQPIDGMEVLSVIKQKSPGTTVIIFRNHLILLSCRFSHERHWNFTCYLMKLTNCVNRPHKSRIVEI